MKDDSLHRNGETTQIIQFPNAQTKAIDNLIQEVNALDLSADPLRGDAVRILDQYGKEIPLPVEPEVLPPSEPQKKEKKLGGITGKGWMPGQSGNPSGKLSKEKLAKKKIEELFDRECPISDRYEAAKKLTGKENPTWGELMVAASAVHALDGDYHFFREFLDRIDGRVLQEIAGKDGGPINLRVRSRSKLTAEQSAALHEYLAGANREDAG